MTGSAEEGAKRAALLIRFSRRMSHNQSRSRFVCGLIVALGLSSGVASRGEDTPQESKKEGAQNPARESQAAPAPPGPDTEKPPAKPAGAGTSSSPAQETQPQIPPRKREITISLSLQEAVRMGLENNLDIKVSQLTERTRERDIVVAQAVFDPFFNMGMSYGKNRDPSVSFFDFGAGTGGVGVRVSPSETLSYYGNLQGKWVLGTQYEVAIGQLMNDRPAASAGGITTLNPVTTSDAAISLRQPLLKGGWYSVNTADIRVAENNFRLSRADAELTVINTVFLIEQAYWGVVFSRENLEAKRKALVVAMEQLDNERKKRKEGASSDIDVATVESQVVLRRVDYEDADLLAETARDTLLHVVNYTGETSLKAHWESGTKVGPFDNIDIKCTTEFSSDPPRIHRDEALAAAFTKRPEYRQLQWTMQNQDILIGVAKNGLLPSFDVLGRWSLLGLESSFDESVRELVSGDYYGWEVGAEFSVPLSNRGPRSKYRNAREELQKLKLRKLDLENQIVLEVDQALRKVDTLRRKVADLKARVKLQETLLEAEKLKLEVGKSIPYIVSVIENDLADGRAQEVRAKADFQTTKAELLRATGTLLEAHQIEIITK